MFESLLICLTLATTQPASAPAPSASPEWVDDPLGWRGFVGADRDFIVKRVPPHVNRWREYRTLAMTPVDDGGAFRAKLAAALRRESVYVTDVPPMDTDLREPAATTRPATPPNVAAMGDAAYAALAAAVQDAWTVLQDQPFDELRQRGYFAGRVPRIEHPQAESANIKDKLGEVVDAAKLTDAQIWSTLRRLYDQRRGAFDGDFNLSGAALDSPRGVACQIFHRSPGHDYNDGLLLARGNANGSGWDDYWRAGLLVCARQMTHPPVTQEELIKRDGRVLRADVQAILELKNGERAPMVMSLFYEPGGKRWWVKSCCFTSSPFLAVVGQAR